MNLHSIQKLVYAAMYTAFSGYDPDLYDYEWVDPAVKVIEDKIELTEKERRLAKMYLELDVKEERTAGLDYEDDWEAEQAMDAVHVEYREKLEALLQNAKSVVEYNNRRMEEYLATFLKRS